MRNTGSLSGADEERIKELLADDFEPGEVGSASLGIRNVNRRIRIIYGEEYGLIVKNDKTCYNYIRKRYEGEICHGDKP